MNGHGKRGLQPSWVIMSFCLDVWEPKLHVWLGRLGIRTPLSEAVFRARRDLWRSLTCFPAFDMW